MLSGACRSSPRWDSPRRVLMKERVKCVGWRSNWRRLADMPRENCSHVPLRKTSQGSSRPRDHGPQLRRNSRFANINSCSHRLPHINHLPSFGSPHLSLLLIWRRLTVYGTRSVRPTAPERIACLDAAIRTNTLPKPFNLISSLHLFPCPFANSTAPHMSRTTAEPTSAISASTSL